MLSSEKWQRVISMLKLSESDLYMKTNLIIER